jgi:hypothetical protein
VATHQSTDPPLEPTERRRSFERKDVEMASLTAPGSPRVPLGGCESRADLSNTPQATSNEDETKWMEQPGVPARLCSRISHGRKSDTAQKQRQCRVNTTSLSHHLITAYPPGLGIIPLVFDLRLVSIITLEVLQVFIFSKDISL